MINTRIKTDELYSKHEVLGNGFVELCDYMGNDETVVRCARQSYGREEDDLTEEDIKRQIDLMLKKGHTSPFEQFVFQFHIKIPIFVARQWVSFRTARLNEISGRYTKFSKEDFYVPEEDSLECRNSYRIKSDSCYTKNEDDSLDITYLQDIIKENNNHSYDAYSNLVDREYPKELSRLALPLTLMTEFYWQMDLHNLLHFLELRMEEHAQKEIREYALVIYEIVNKICPISIDSFTRYKFNALTLGEEEINVMFNIFKNLQVDNISKEEKALFTRVKNMQSIIEDRRKVLDKI
jgi:thymidylate synthase (FAD)